MPGKVSDFHSSLKLVINHSQPLFLKPIDCTQKQPSDSKLLVVAASLVSLKCPWYCAHQCPVPVHHGGRLAVPLLQRALDCECFTCRQWPASLHLQNLTVALLPRRTSEASPLDWVSWETRTLRFASRNFFGKCSQEDCLRRSERSRTGQRRKWNCSAVAKKPRQFPRKLWRCPKMWHGPAFGTAMLDAGCSWEPRAE